MEQVHSYKKFERIELSNIIQKYNIIIRNKKNDPNTIALKRKTWIRITNEFNRLPNVRPRLVKQVKRYWENRKARASRAYKNGVDDDSNDSSQLLQKMIESPELVEFAKSELLHLPPVTQIQLNDFEANCNIIDSNKRATAIEWSKQENVVDIKSIIDAQIIKMNESKAQQNELHQLALRREQIQIKLLEQQLKEQSGSHIAKHEREQELHNLRINHEQELHIQRLNHEQEFHQKRMIENHQTITNRYNSMHNINNV